MQTKHVVALILINSSITLGIVLVDHGMLSRKISELENKTTVSAMALGMVAEPAPPPRPPTPFADPDCQNDLKKLCPKSTDRPSKNMCLQDHFEVVSSDCRKSLQAARDLLKNCNDAIEKFCSHVGYGGNRMAQCLSSHLEKLSSACREVINR